MPHKAGQNDPCPTDLRDLGVREMLEEARRAAVALLLEKVKCGEATAAELAVLRNMLRDNGLIMGFEYAGDAPPSDRIGFELPELDAEDED